MLLCAILVIESFEKALLFRKVKGLTETILDSTICLHHRNRDSIVTSLPSTLPQIGTECLFCFGNYITVRYLAYISYNPLYYGPAADMRGCHEQSSDS